MKMKVILKNILKMFMITSIVLTATACKLNNKNNDVTTVVKGYDGALLKGATVTINETSGVTDEDGIVVLSVKSQEDDIVVQVSENGFVNQSVTAALADEATSVQVIMHPVKEVLSIVNIEAQQVIKGESLGAQISLPANSLVKPNGELADGNATLHLTPWDVSNSELFAMLGNGQAIDAQGNSVELISAGMMSVDFYDTEGNHLQLVSGVTADIQMDLTQLSINNQGLSVGDTIPLWHFDENQGLWIEDGVGLVVSSATSSTGMAISATVEHFSTWNWDYKFQNAGSVNVSCQLPNGTSTACNVVANVTLDDGSHLTKSNSIPAEGAHIINMPTSATIEWSASTTTGLIGTQTSGTSGDVLIILGEPATQNFVQCDVNGTAIACDVTLENPSGDNYTFSIPVSGATIATAIDGVSSLSWSATTGKISENGLFVSYTGNTVSGVSGTVALHLDTRVEYGTAARTIYLKCTNPSSLPLTTCNIDVWGRYEERFAVYNDVPIGSSVLFTIPDGINPDDYFSFNAMSLDVNGTQYDYYGDGSYPGDEYYGNTSVMYSEIVNNQVLEIEIGARQY